MHLRKMSLLLLKEGKVSITGVSLWVHSCFYYLFLEQIGHKPVVYLTSLWQQTLSCRMTGWCLWAWGGLHSRFYICPLLPGSRVMHCSHKCRLDEMGNCNWCLCQQKPSSPDTDASTSSIPVSTADGDKPFVSDEKKDLFDDGKVILFLLSVQLLLVKLLFL